MNFSYSNRALIIFILAAILLLFAPIYNLSVILYSTPLISFENISSQFAEIKLLIKGNPTFGVLGFLSFFVFSYLTITFIYSYKLRGYILAALIVFGLGGLGYFFNHQEILKFRKGNQQFLEVDGNKNKVEVFFRFNSFPENFLQDLMAAERGEMKIYINQRICSDGKGKVKAILNGRELPTSKTVLLSQEEVSRIIQKEVIPIRVYGEKLPLELRDLKGSALSTREDRLSINGKDIALSYDKVFCISFYAQSKEGRILRIYV